jgi:hypothetical protein
MYPPKNMDAHKFLISYDKVQKWSATAYIKLDQGLWLTYDKVKDIVKTRFFILGGKIILLMVIIKGSRLSNLQI